ncbi:MAG TPA: transposase, partial [Cytophagales bacterium]
HLLVGTRQKPLNDILRDFKAFTSRRIRERIHEHPQESRKAWMLWLIQRAGTRDGHNDEWQLWQPGYHPVELENWLTCKQKLDYIHYNPVVAGFVDQPDGWLYSSARDYGGGKGLLEVQVLEG